MDQEDIGPDGGQAENEQASPPQPGAFRRALSALGAIGRRKPAQLQLPAPVQHDEGAGTREAYPPVAPDATPRSERDRHSLGSSTPDVASDDLGDQLKRLRKVIEDHDPLARAEAPAAPAAPAPVPTVALNVRLATPLGADEIGLDPELPPRIVNAVLAQLPAGARIVALVVETPTS